MSVNMYVRVKPSSKPAYTPAPTGLQRSRASRQSEPVNVPPALHDVINAPGHPLEPATRSAMESRLGYNFGQVRIHNDAAAASTAQALSAAAYTRGFHIGFGAGQYAPGTSKGQRLLAHELTHVVQQMRSGAAPQEIAPVEHASEMEAERIAMGTAFSPSALPGGRLQRQLLQRLVEIPGEEAAAEMNLVQGFLDGARDAIPVDNFFKLQEELMQPANAASYMGGAIVGILKGAGLELLEAIEGLVKLAAKAALYSNPALAALTELYEYGRDPKGYTEHMRQQGEMLNALRTGLQTFVQQTLNDPTFLERIGTELGYALGQNAGAWFNDKFMKMSSYKKGETIGEVEGRIILEIALLFVGPEEIAARVAPAVAKLAEGTRLGRAILEMLEKIPALQKILEARRLAGVGREALNVGEKGTVIVGRGLEAAEREAPKVAAGVEKGTAVAQDVSHSVSSAEQKAAGVEQKLAGAEQKATGVESQAAHAGPSAPQPIQKPGSVPEPKAVTKAPTTPKEAKAVKPRIEKKPPQPKSVPPEKVPPEATERSRDILEEFAEAQGKGTREGIEADIQAQQGVRTAKKPGGAPQPEKFDVGNFAHDYAEELIGEDRLPRGLDKEVEVSLPDGAKKRLDRVDRVNGKIYEIKPDTPSQVAAGEDQIKIYIEYMNREQPLGGGREWQGEVVTYNRDTTVRLLRRIGWLK